MFSRCFILLSQAGLLHKLPTAIEYLLHILITSHLHLHPLTPQPTMFPDFQFLAISTYNSVCIYVIFINV